LHAGGDLGWIAGWRAGRHLAKCAQCRDDVAALSGMCEVLPDLNEIPEIAWNRCKHWLERKPGNAGGPEPQAVRIALKLECGSDA